MQLDVYSISGKKTSKKLDLPESIFNAEPNDHCVYLDVKQHLANRRQGTHKSKERAEIARTTKIKAPKRYWWCSRRFNEIASIYWWRSCIWSKTS